MAVCNWIFREKVLVLENAHRCAVKILELAAPECPEERGKSD
jgi:hypothetical protein